LTEIATASSGHYYLLQTIKNGATQMANEGYHEPIDELTDDTRDMHRAITSLMEELEAVDWYNQRVDAAKDPELAGKRACGDDSRMDTPQGSVV
jgi:hypothetical protein